MKFACQILPNDSRRVQTQVPGCHSSDGFKPSAANRIDIDSTEAFCNVPSNVTSVRIKHWECRKLSKNGVVKLIRVSGFSFVLRIPYAVVVPPDAIASGNLSPAVAALITPAVTDFVPQPLENPHRRITMLRRSRLIFFQNLQNPSLKRPQFWSPLTRPLRVCPRLRLAPQNLPNLLPRMMKTPSSLANAHPITMSTPDPSVHALDSRRSRGISAEHAANGCS